MRVVFCVDNMNIGGTELNAVRTAEQLSLRNVDVRIICLGSEGPLVSRYEAAGLPVHFLRLRTFASLHAIRRGMWLARYIRKQRIDVVHAHDLYSNIFSAPWSRIAGARLITSRRWLKPPERLSHRVANARAYQMSHVVLANAPSIGRYLVDNEHVSPGKVVVIENFIEAEAFSPPPPDWINRTRSELRLPEGSITIGVLASLRPIKDHVTLIRAVAAIADEFPDLHLVIAGADYGIRPALESLIADSQIKGRVRFAGLMPSRPSPHYLFDIAALTSRSEGFPNSLLEAMAARRPVVASNVGGIPDVVRDDTGFLVSPGDIEGFANAFRSLLGDRNLRAQLGEAGGARAAHCYSVDAALSNLTAAYNKALSDGARGGTSTQ